MKTHRMKVLTTCILVGLLLIASCTPESPVNVEEAKASVDAHSEELLKEWKYLYPWHINDDDIPELCCYNYQDTLENTKDKAGATLVTRPDYSRGCMIYQIISKDSVKRIAHIFGEGKLLGSVNGFRVISTETEVTKEQMEGQDLKGVGDQKLTFERVYNFNPSIWEYEEVRWRYLLHTPNGTVPYLGVDN